MVKLFNISKQTRDKTPTFVMAPLIDVIFILLIFFAVTTSFIKTQKGIDMKLPTAQSSEQAPEGIVVSLDQDGEIYLNKEVVTLTNLEKVIASSISKNADLAVIFQAHSEINYAAVIEVLDSLRLSGAYRIVLESQAKKY
jgi:biopolymer transport protein ExbD